ncbi:MAG: pseudouridine synthase [Desulfovibrio fairfieldensis]|nr:pseudouridine synthase [Desulfovibrio fairfieldensis]
MRSRPARDKHKEHTRMELEFRFRNNDLGPHFPTFQERVNAMLPARPAEPEGISAEAAAPVLPTLEKSAPLTPHMPNSEEVRQTLAQVEEEAVLQSRELIQAHSGLNEQRVARLLGLLD